MTEPRRRPGGPSPLRVGGLALLGAGAVAALIGLATLLPGGGSTTTPAATTPPPAPAAAPTRGAGSHRRRAARAQPPRRPCRRSAPTAAVAGAAGGTARPLRHRTAPAPAPAPAPRRPRLPPAGGHRRRQRGGTRARPRLQQQHGHRPRRPRRQRLPRRRLAGRPGGQLLVAGIIPTSTVYYRPGTAEQSTATSIASEFGLRAEPRFSGIDDATPGLIVIVTNDYQKRK